MTGHYIGAPQPPETEASGTDESGIRSLSKPEMLEPTQAVPLQELGAPDAGGSSRRELPATLDGELDFGDLLRE